MVFSISAAKQQLVQPLLSYNYILSGIPNVPTLNIRGAQIPGKEVEDIAIKLRGRTVHFNGNIAVFRDLTLTVFEDISYTARTMIELWTQVMAENSSGFGFAAPVVTKDITLFVLAPGTEHVVAAYMFRNAFPKSIGDVTLSYDNTTTVVEYPVTFAYDWWERADISNFNSLSDIASQIGIGG